MRTHGLKFDVNCSILFTELPLLERPAAAKAAGFDAVEFWWPFTEPAPPDHETDAFVAALKDAGVQLAALNFAAGDMAAGDRGWVSDPMKITAFRDNVDVCVGIADRTGCAVLNALYGNRPDGESKDDLAVLNLTIAARTAAQAGATVVIEALNSQENPRYPVTSSQTAIDVIDAVRAEGAPNVAFLADLYHLAMMGEDLPSVLTDCREYIAHIQIADVPGRGAPGTGNLDFEVLFAQLAAQDYSGWVGCEFRHNAIATTPTIFTWRQS
jgi:hydroxypyruvate isomerase